MEAIKVLHEPNKRNKLLISGYIRESQNIFKDKNSAYFNIPSLATQVVLAYHYIHVVSDYSDDSDKYLAWWQYKYVTSDGKYKINIEWQQQGHTNWHKVAARNFTLNGQNMKLISFSFGAKHGYSQHEIIRFSIPETGTVCRLYWIKKNQWCFDDGIGIYSNVSILRMSQIGYDTFI
eukprot:283928_1